MARSEVASPSVAKGIGFKGAPLASRTVLTGHAKLLAQPAYKKLLSAEPFLRRLIPILIFVFLAIVGAVRFVDLTQFRSDRESDARSAITMIASVLSTSLSRDVAATAGSDDIRNALADALPGRALDQGREIFVTDSSGTVVATAPRVPELEGVPLTDIIGEAQPLTTFGARAGVLKVTIAGGETALGAVHHLGDGLGDVAVIQGMEQVYSQWRAEVSLNVAIFVATSSILLVILYGYFTQSARAAEADRIYSETQQRFETALTRGRCGLWDWDLSQARIFWSRSMFEIAGLTARDTLLGFGEVNRLVHPDDGDLMALVESLYDAGETTVDRIFRIRHADGRWIWLRARAELINRDTPRTAPDRHCSRRDRADAVGRAVEDRRHPASRRHRNHLGSVRAVGRGQSPGDVQFQVSAASRYSPCRAEIRHALCRGHRPGPQTGGALADRSEQVAGRRGAQF